MTDVMRPDSAASFALGAEAMRLEILRRIGVMRGRANGPGQEQRKHALRQVEEAAFALPRPAPSDLDASLVAVSRGDLEMLRLAVVTAQARTQLLDDALASQIARITDMLGGTR